MALTPESQLALSTLAHINLMRTELDKLERAIFDFAKLSRITNPTPTIEVKPLPFEENN